MSIDTPKSPEHAPDEALPVGETHEDESRKRDVGGAGDFAAEALINGAQMVIDGVGNVVSSVVSSLGDIG